MLTSYVRAANLNKRFISKVVRSLIFGISLARLDWSAYSSDLPNALAAILALASTLMSK